MYLDYWRLEKTPFDNVPSESLFFRSPQHDEAFSRLLYMVEHRKGVAMLTGEVGCGKTTVTKALVNHLNQNRYQLRLLCNPALTPIQLIKAILISFGVHSQACSKPVLLEQLRNLLMSNAAQGISTVLAIDEAHVIVRQETLDEIRMLLNIQADEQFLISLIMLGQPPLLKRISELQPLKERISVKFHLGPMDYSYTQRYVVFRLKNVGAVRGMFSREAIRPIYDFSGGIPLRINNVCDRALLIGYMRKAPMVNSDIVAEAIEDLQ